MRSVSANRSLRMRVSVVTIAMRCSQRLSLWASGSRTVAVASGGRWSSHVPRIFGQLRSTKSQLSAWRALRR